jgi:hypothetical protein
MHLRRDFQAQGVEPDEAGASSWLQALVGAAAIVAGSGGWFMRAESDTPQFDNCQPSRQPGQQLRLAHK